VEHLSGVEVDRVQGGGHATVPLGVGNASEEGAVDGVELSGIDVYLVCTPPTVE
jgi:hypothetical protein